MAKHENPNFLKSRLFKGSIEKLCQPPPLEKYTEEKYTESPSFPHKLKHLLPGSTLFIKSILLLVIVALLSGGFFKFAWHRIKPATSQTFVYLKSPCPDFVGREEYLDELYKQLITNWEPRTVRIQGLWGKGGFGKSELAIEFANRFRNSFSSIWTFHCDSKESIKQGYQDLAKQLGVFSPSDTLAKTQEKVHFHLENGNFNKPWLLLFDNVEETLPDYPQRGGVILFTSQKKLYNPQYLLEIKPFSKDESLELLENITGEEQSASMEKLAQDLERIPLLINYAAHYIKSTPGCHTSDYQNLFCRHLFEKAGPLWKEMDVNRRYLKSLASSWQFSLTALEKEKPEALAWLYVCSYLYSENIPEIWIDDWLSQQNPNSCSNPQLKRKEILKSLQNYGIIQFNEQTRTFSLHRFFQYMIRESRHHESQEDLYKAFHLLSKYNKDYNFFQPVSWEAAKYWYIHVYEFTKWMDKYPEYFSDPASLQRKSDLFAALGRWNLFNYHFSPALEDFHKAIDLFRSSRKGIIPTSALGYYSSCLGIGYSHYKLGQYRQALNFFHRCENDFLRYRDENPLELSTFNLVKGLCHEELREYDAALLCYQKSLEINRNYPGDKLVEGLFTFDTMTFCALGEIGRVLKSMGRYEESMKFFNEALALGEKTVGKDHPFHLSYTIEKAHVILLMGEPEKALKKMQDSIHEFLALYPKQSGILDHFSEELGYCWCSLGHVYLQLDLPKKAKQMFKKARRYDSRTQGEKFFPQSYLGMGLVYLKEKNVKKGLKYLLRRLQLYAEYEITPEHMAPLLEEFQITLQKNLQIKGSIPHVFKASREASLLSDEILGKNHALTEYFRQLPSTIDNSKVKI